MSIVTRLAFPKKNFQDTVFDVIKFSAGSILIVRIYIDKSIYTSKSSFFSLFSIPWFPLILYPYSEFRFGFYGKFYTGYCVLKFFFIFLFQQIKIEKIAENDVKFCIKNRLFLRLFNFHLYQMQNFLKKF